MELCLVSLYCVQKSVISNLAVNNVMFHVSHVTIIEPKLYCLNMMLVPSPWCTLIARSKSVSMVILNLCATAENGSMFAREFCFVKQFEW